MRSTPPAGALKSVRWVSMRAEVHCPEPSRIGVMRRLPAPSWATLLVLFVYVWISPVPHLAGPPGYCVPVSMIQLPQFGSVLAAPVKSSAQTWVQPDGGGGRAALAVTASGDRTADGDGDGRDGQEIGYGFSWTGPSLGLRTGDGDERESALAEVSCVLRGVVNMYVYRLPAATGRRQTACSSAVQAVEVTR